MSSFLECVECCFTLLSFPGSGDASTDPDEAICSFGVVNEVFKASSSEFTYGHKRHPFVRFALQRGNPHTVAPPNLSQGCQCRTDVAANSPKVLLGCNCVFMHSLLHVCIAGNVKDIEKLSGSASHFKLKERKRASILEDEQTASPSEFNLWQ